MIAATVLLLAQTVATLPSAPPAPPASGAAGEPARALPATVTICRDVAAHRCWTLRGEADCGGLERVFRTVIAADEREGIADCEASLRDGARH